MASWNWFVVGPLLLFFTITFLFTWWIRGKGFGEFLGRRPERRE